MQGRARKFANANRRQGSDNRDDSDEENLGGNVNF